VSPSGSVAEQPIFTSNGERTDAVFAGIIRQAAATMSMINSFLFFASCLRITVQSFS
jgi:hypothetical protein